MATAGRTAPTAGSPTIPSRPSFRRALLRFWSLYAGQQPLANPYGVRQSGLIGGLEAGYNWQVDPRWVVGLEADFNGANVRGGGNSTSVLSSTTNISLNTMQTTDWYDTVRGRIGWLATPNLMVFGTGGWAYGQARQSATFTFASPLAGTTGAGAGGFVVTCTNNVSCYSGSSAATNSGWVAGGGIEWMFDRHWSAKIEYQFVDLGSATVVATAPKALIGMVSSYNVIFKDQVNIVRVGVNYRF